MHQMQSLRYYVKCKNIMNSKQNYCMDKCTKIYNFYIFTCMLYVGCIYTLMKNINTLKLILQLLQIFCSFKLFLKNVQKYAFISFKPP